MANLTEINFDEVAPNASAMIESLRAYGYTLSTAIADIIDNSISARCQNVWLTLEWDDGSPWIAITDDGHGMGEAELVQSMRLGSTSPLETRRADDLGRFGLGLKTASFSQARRLTVMSQTSSEKSSIRRWDLDHLNLPEVSGWQLLRSPHPESNKILKKAATKIQTSGTVVLLEILDRIHPSAHQAGIPISDSHWVNEIARLREHLSMVFHRFLSDRTASGVKIWLNDTPLDPWDPFCENEEATQKLASDHESTLRTQVTVTGFVLPHRDRFDPTDPARSAKLHNQASGPAGWNGQQGFYLYRNRRLIIPGDWLGLGPGQNGWKKEEHYKLARIRVDIPNSMDHLWQIDVKKSTAIAPPALRDWMTGLAKTIREKARDVYAHRGGRPRRSGKKTTAQAHPWQTRKSSDGTFSYRIDRSHHLFQALLSRLPAASSTDLETLLRLIEETVPVQRIWIDTADHQEGAASPFETEADSTLRAHLLTCHRALVEGGNSPDEAWNELYHFPAFQTTKAQALIGLLREKPSV